MPIVVVSGIGLGFGLHILCSLIGYAIRECIKFFKLADK